MINSPVSHLECSPPASIRPLSVPRKIRLAVVGLGYGAAIARELLQDRRLLEVAAVCDMNRERATQVSQELRVPHIDFASLLADPGIDAVALFCGPRGRAGLIKQIIRAGKDVLTTKPFETDVTAAREVLEEAVCLGRVIHLNSPSPKWADDIRQIMAWQDEHQLGRPVAMRAETWAHYREKPDGSWYDDPAICGAAPLLRLGIYFFNEFAALLGQPECVQVMHSRLFTQRPTADHAQMSVRYTDGRLGHIFSSFCVNDGTPYRDAVTLNYDHGTIRRWVERANRDSAGSHFAVVELQLPKASGVQRVTTLPGRWCGWYQWDAFHSAVLNRSVSDAAGIEQILFGIRLLDAATRSAMTGACEPVRLGE